MHGCWVLLSHHEVGGSTLHDEVGVNSKMGPQLTERHEALTMLKWVGAASEARVDMTTPP